MATRAKRTLYERFNTLKPRFYKGMVLTRADVLAITNLFKTISSLKRALRDLQEK